MNRSVLLFRDVKALAKKERSTVLQRFFKTGKGEYAEGDIFLGLTVPECRILAKKYQDLPLSDVEKVLASPVHEERLIALFILVHQFAKGTQRIKNQIYALYLANIQYINNWDLVDSSADKIVGGWLFAYGGHSRGGGNHNRKNMIPDQVGDDKDKVLKRLAVSKNIWERRIAIIATFQFIKNGDPRGTLAIAEILLHDKHDLIHKAVGWMLREVGKRCSQEAEEEFLKKHYKTMPRTMLRYAIEHFPEKKRKFYLAT